MQRCSSWGAIRLWRLRGAVALKSRHSSDYHTPLFLVEQLDYLGLIKIEVFHVNKHDRSIQRTEQSLKDQFNRNSTANNVCLARSNNKYCDGQGRNFTKDALAPKVRFRRGSSPINLSLGQT
jgi:hypothetical protein